MSSVPVADSPTPTGAAADLAERFARIQRIEHAVELIDWDTETMMPEGAATGRSEMRATLSVLAHELITDPRIADWLADAEEQDDGGDPWQTANLREMRRQHLRATAIPADLVEAASKAASACEMAWRGARRDNRFADVLPSLREVLVCERMTGEAAGAALGLSAYDALLNQFEPDARAAEIDRLFDDLAPLLPGLTEAALEGQRRAPAPLPLPEVVPVEQQRQLGEKLMRHLGFDFTRGRLDVSLHPFCGGGGPDDVRITTRFVDGDVASALSATLHETGHALYEQGLPVAWRGQPVGTARGMTAHESQSMLVEIHLTRSPAFLAFAAPLMREALGNGADSAVFDPDNLFRVLTRVERSLIRVDADEVTYPAHVILRFRLERAMIQGDLDPADLPGAWAEGMQSLIGTAPPDDATGCLQDIHWYGGLWGYFPTYLLGRMMAAQLWAAAREQLPDMDDALRRGDAGGLVAWLRTQIHTVGSLLSNDDLVRAATGKRLDATALIAHLKDRYDRA